MVNSAADSQGFGRVLIAAVLFWGFAVAAQDFRFDGAMSRAVLERYLSRSISFTELLHDDLTQARNKRGVDPRDNLRLILDTKAKLVGRAVSCLGQGERTAGVFGNGKALRRRPAPVGSGDYPAGGCV